MFDKKKKMETKQYSVSAEDVSNIMQSVQGEWLMQKLFNYAINGFNKDISDMQNNLVAKLSIDKTKYDVDWSTLFKDSKIYTHPKPEPKPEEKKEDAKPELPKRKQPGKKD